MDKIRTDLRDNKIGASVQENYRKTTEVVRQTKGGKMRAR